MAEPAPTMSFRILQALVFGMGILLILGFIAFGYALMQRATQNKAAAQADTPAGTQQAVLPASLAVGGSAASIPAFDPRTLPIPAGTSIMDMDVNGSTLVLRLEWKDGTGGGFLWIYDLKTHQPVGELRYP